MGLEIKISQLQQRKQKNNSYRKKVTVAIKNQRFNPQFIAGPTFLNLYNLQRISNSHLFYSSWLFGVIE